MSKVSVSKVSDASSDPSDPNDPLAMVRWVWKNGELIKFEDATVHVLTHALHYGSGWFEGIRCYDTARGPAVFRLREHMERLVASCKIFRADLPFSVDEMCQAAIDTISANAYRECYVRPIVFRGFGAMGVNPLNNPIESFVIVWPWGKYLGDEAIERGVDACVSTWRRLAPSGFPASAKATGTYLNSQLIKMEAVLGGFAEGIALDESGHLSEGSGENLFLVSDGVLLTPPRVSSILPGITRKTIIALAEELGIPVRRKRLPRAMLYTCDEAFFTGTAAEVTPIRSVDRIPVGQGRPGPITLRLQEAYMEAVRGRLGGRHGWLTYCEPTVEAQAESQRSAEPVEVT